MTSFQRRYDVVLTFLRRRVFMEDLPKEMEFCLISFLFRVLLFFYSH